MSDASSSSTAIPYPEPDALASSAKCPLEHDAFVSLAVCALPAWSPIAPQVRCTDGLLTSLLGAQLCMQSVLAESLEGVIRHAMLRFFLMPSRRDGLLHHNLLLQVVLFHPGQPLLIWSVLLRVSLVRFMCFPPALLCCEECSSSAFDRARGCNLELIRMEAWCRCREAADRKSE
jgi:hypothetical protein